MGDEDYMRLTAALEAEQPVSILSLIHIFGKAKCVCQREGLVIYAGSAYNVDLFVLCTVFQGFLKRGITL